jgi:hypothetical protein
MWRLGDDVIAFLFGFLEIEELSSMMRVCKRWNAVGSSGISLDRVWILKPE